MASTGRSGERGRTRFAFKGTSIVMFVHVLKQVPFGGKTTNRAANVALIRFEIVRCMY